MSVWVLAAPVSGRGLGNPDGPPVRMLPQVGVKTLLFASPPPCRLSQ